MLSTGLGRSNDVAQAERNLAEDRIALRRREYAVLAAKRALNIAMARTPDTPVEIAVEAEMTKLVLPARESLVSQALEARPELESTKSELEVLKKNISIAVADYYPVVSLYADYARQSRKPGRVFNLPHENYYATLGLAIEWNIFNGLQTNAAVEQAELELTRVEATYSEQKRLVQADVEDAYDIAALALDAHAISLEAIRAAEEAVRLARGLYAEGRVTLLELRDAELRLTVQRLTAIEARNDLEIAEERLRRSIGGTTPWTDAS
jgi:outer membrane protein TolC